VILAEPVSSSGIVYASFDRFPAPKGAAVHIRAFTEALGRAFGGVDLLAIGGDTEEPLPEGIRYHPLRAEGPDLIAQAMGFRAQLASWWQGRSRASVVHVRSIFEGYPIARRKERLTEHLVFEVNGLPSIELKYHAPGVAEDEELLRKLVAQEDFCLARADLLLTPSAVTADHLVSRGVAPGRIRVIPNGVDTGLFSFQAPRPWEERPVRLLYSGTMTSWQGVHHAIEACRLLRRDLPAVLTLVGPTRRQQRRELLDLCGELVGEGAVELLEPLPQSELARLHHACDVVLVPLPANDRNLVQGCCPLKLLEAMASGTPVVASDLPVVRAAAEHGEHALLVRPGSPKAIAEAVQALKADPALGPRLSQQARARVERDFTWARAQESLVAAYEEAFGMARSSTRWSTSASACA
jgi:glycosyltransferase involved in cell wall biosynthesis